MKRLLAALVFVAAATPALGCTSDDDRTDRIDIEATDLRPRFDDDRRVVAFIAREDA